MSRNIVNDHLWTDSEVEYQKSRNRGDLVSQNRKMFGPGGELEGQDLSQPEPEQAVLELDKDIYDYVVALDTAGLQEALRKRKIQPKGDDNVMKTVLAEHIQKGRDAKSNS